MMNTSNVKKVGIMKLLKTVIILPVLFATIVFLAAYMAILPYASMITSAFSLVSTQNPPSFDSGLESIFTQSSEVNAPPKSNEDINTEAKIEQPSNEPLNEMIDVSSITMPKYEQHYANISIPDLQIDCKLYYGDSDAVLKNGAGQFMGSRLPGFGRPILIAAHNMTHFRELEWAEIGSIVQIETGYGTYEYKIYETRIAKYNDETAYDLTLEKEILMLYTCYPFGSLGYKSDRFFVYASKISGLAVDW